MCRLFIIGFIYWMNCMSHIFNWTKIIGISLLEKLKGLSFDAVRNELILEWNLKYFVCLFSTCWRAPMLGKLKENIPHLICISFKNQIIWLLITTDLWIKFSFFFFSNVNKIEIMQYYNFVRNIVIKINYFFFFFSLNFKIFYFSSAILRLTFFFKHHTTDYFFFLINFIYIERSFEKHVPYWTFHTYGDYVS